MARPIIRYSTMHGFLYSSKPINATVLFPLIGMLSMFSIVAFLCLHKKNKKLSQRQKEENNTSFQSRDTSLVSKLNSNIKSKALSMSKMISWRKVQVEEQDNKEIDGIEKESDDEVWRKTIIRGERCRPLEFSGKIEYDSHGNLVSDDHDYFSY